MMRMCHNMMMKCPMMMMMIVFDCFVCCITYVHCGPSENLMRSIAMGHEIKSFFQRANNNDDGT